MPPVIESVSAAEALRVEDVKLEARRLKPGEEALWGQKKEECEHAQSVLEARLYRNQSYTEVTAPLRTQLFRETPSPRGEVGSQDTWLQGF